MSHSLLGVILPKGTELAQAEAEIAKMLVPFDENMEVAPYKHYLDRSSLEGMVKQYGCDVAVPSSFVPHVKDWTGNDGGLDDTGVYQLRTYNPQSKWDWYSIGGRWDGELSGKEGPQTWEQVFADHHLKDNACLVRELTASEKLFALLTPEGEWQERGDMGWFGVVHDEKQPREWDAIRSEILSAYPDNIIVGVDVHI